MISVWSEFLATCIWSSYTISCVPHDRRARKSCCSSQRRWFRLKWSITVLYTYRLLVWWLMFLPMFIHVGTMFLPWHSSDIWPWSRESLNIFVIHGAMDSAQCWYFIRSSAVPWVISEFYSHECNIVHSRERAWSQSRQGNLNPPGYRQNETDHQRWNLWQCHCRGIRLLISVSLSGINHDCVLWFIIRSSWQHPPSKLCVLARFASGIALWVPWHL